DTGKGNLAGSMVLDDPLLPGLIGIAPPSHGRAAGIAPVLALRVLFQGHMHGVNASVVDKADPLAIPAIEAIGAAPGWAEITFDDGSLDRTWSIRFAAVRINIWSHHGAIGARGIVKIIICRCKS